MRRSIGPGAHFWSKPPKLGRLTKNAVLLTDEPDRHGTVRPQKRKPRQPAKGR